jgi:hypothetical protein
MMAIQQTQSMIMTPARVFVKKDGWHPCRPEFIDRSTRGGEPNAKL